MSTYNRYLDIFNFNTALEQLPGLHLWIKDTDLYYRNLNSHCAELLGFRNPENAIGKTDYDLPCGAVNFADIFRENDKDVMQNKVTKRYLEIQPCAHGEWKILSVVKTPLIVHDNVQGVLGYCTDITNSFIRLEHLLVESMKAQKKLRQFHHPIDQTLPKIQLTSRQAECLFFLLRGKTSKETAKLLNLSPRTVEDHVENLKSKFKCKNKSELFETALKYGFFNNLPATILRMQTSIEI